MSPKLNPIVDIPVQVLPMLSNNMANYRSQGCDKTESCARAYESKFEQCDQDWNTRHEMAGIPPEDKVIQPNHL